MLTGENGILTQAQNAQSKTEEAQLEEENILNSYESFLNSYSGENTEFTDSLGNIVIVPAGFKVVNPEDNVEDGIVIEDVVNGATKGSQFVWIPVGENIKKEDGNVFNIKLGRYVFNEDGTVNEELTKTEPTEELKDNESANSKGYFTEGLKDDITINAHAKDIQNFITSVNNNGGFYIARYEARTTKKREDKNEELTTLTVRKNDYVYNRVTQSQASSLSINMYNNSNFTSDLVNSYAWDTALVFIQECSENSKYSRSHSLMDSFLDKGTDIDVVCNIYDMASNCIEWTTETYSIETVPVVTRGENFNISNNFYTSYRNGNNIVNNTGSGEGDSFRPILYLNK